MSDLIKRADVIKAIEELRKEPHWLHDGDDYRVCGLSEAEDAIERLPSADRPQGEWAKRTHSTLIALVNFAYCSECGQPIMHEHTRPLWSYCPNCGAKMDGERKESE